MGNGVSYLGDRIGMKRVLLLGNLTYVELACWIELRDDIAHLRSVGISGEPPWTLQLLLPQGTCHEASSYHSPAGAGKEGGANARI